jgi:hypothetical protein
MFYSLAMRRGDPERIYQAKRMGMIARLSSPRTGIGAERAEALVATLESDADSLGLRRGSIEFWREADRRANLAR